MGNISLVGLALVLAGELLRKTAMVSLRHRHAIAQLPNAPMCRLICAW